MEELSSTGRENLVLSAACNYSPQVLAAFLVSLHRHSPSAIPLFISERNDKDYLRDLRVYNPHVQLFKMPWHSMRSFMKKVAEKQKYPGQLSVVNTLSLSGSALVPIFRGLLSRSAFDHFVSSLFQLAPARFFIYRLILGKLTLSERHKPAKVLLTDCADVIFQRDPFELMDGVLTTGYEDQSIGNCSYNRSWIARMYGQQRLSSMGSLKIICAGVVCGSFQNIADYLDALCGELEHKLPRTAFAGGVDQAAHNGLLHGGTLPHIRFVKNGEPLLATIGWSPSHGMFELDALNGIVSANGVLPSIVHQYNRHPRFIDWVKNLYG